MQPTAKKTLIVSHRGIAPGFVENTIAAFQEVVRRGCEMIELDVHETKDSELIIFHDKYFRERNTQWGKLTLNEIHDSLLTKGVAPRLADCVKAITPMPLNVEIKSYQNRDRFFGELKKISFPRGSFISSYRYGLLTYLHKQKIAAPLFPVLALPNQLKPIFPLGKTLLRLLYSFIPDFFDGISVNNALVSRGLVRAVHARNKQIHVWTVNDEARMRELAQWGVDGIITNDVLLLKQVMSEQREA